MTVDCGLFPLGEGLGHDPVFGAERSGQKTRISADPGGGHLLWPVDGAMLRWHLGTFPDLQAGFAVVITTDNPVPGTFACGDFFRIKADILVDHVGKFAQAVGGAHFPWFRTGNKCFHPDVRTEGRGKITGGCTDLDAGNNINRRGKIGDGGGSQGLFHEIPQMLAGTALVKTEPFTLMGTDCESLPIQTAATRSGV